MGLVEFKDLGKVWGSRFRDFGFRVRQPTAWP